MKLEIQTPPRRPAHPKDRPFPWYCLRCRQNSIRPAFIEDRTKVEHDQQTYELVIHELEVAKCEICGETWFDISQDYQINGALRMALNLLQPEQIRSNREALH